MQVESGHYIFCFSNLNFSGHRVQRLSTAHLRFRGVALGPFTAPSAEV